ncbi:hypothetical protein [Streptomyces sp. AK02-01A]|uniref:hypothetical protein n=1 Tax=Streptomyces sp. AK02-01A TaxID=3028648 RepID=UPI0029B2E9FD|nr:hypothetical protein [Streptomyces sp. AK02-01A]MDX3855754.1 hypothetical protein [Streptomyces sp. AK02-01A]
MFELLNGAGVPVAEADELVSRLEAGTSIAVVSSAPAVVQCSIYFVRLPTASNSQDVR